MAGFQIKRCPDVVEAAAAARFIGSKVAMLHKAAKDLGPGIRLTGKGGRTATYIGKHPDPDYLMPSCWRIAEPTAQEVG